MRVLIAVALGAGIAIAGNACYSPTVADCQFTCTPTGGECPEDQTCTAGFCRDEGATGTCSGGSGSAMCATPPAGCVAVVSTSTLCLASCASTVEWSTAEGGCTDSWRLAVLDTDPKREAASVMSGIHWIGLQRTATTNAWTWISGGGTVAIGSNWSAAPNNGSANALAGNCGGLDGSDFYSDGCGALTTHPFACSN